MTWIQVSEDGRQNEERLTDRALLLLAVGFGEKCGRLDEFRLMKIPFTVQHRLNQERIKSFSYRFFKEEHGPISKAIYADRDVLKGAGLLEGGVASRSLTPLGEKLFEVLRKGLKGTGDNDHVIAVVKEQAGKICKARDWETIKKAIYSMSVRVPNMKGELTVEKAPLKADVLFKLPAESAKGTVVLPRAMRDTLALAFSLTPSDLEAASTDSGLTLEEVFAA